MRVLLASLLFFLAPACEISPVVSAPTDAPGIRYSDCDRAAEDYCENAIKASEEEMDACVAEYRFKCLSSRASASTASRS